MKSVQQFLLFRRFLEAVMIALEFAQTDALLAWESWKCNCGPSALAAVIGLSLDQVRPFVEKSGFAEKGYMAPTMMKTALAAAGWHIAIANRCGKDLGTRFPNLGLARIQWTGPWTAEGANPKWAYRQTHWVASWVLPQKDSKEPVIFDINGGLLRQSEWEKTIVPLITASVPRADGGWFLTHSWEVVRSQHPPAEAGGL